MKNIEKIAVLIFAHKDFYLLDRLVSTLQNKNFDIFIHFSFYSNFSLKEKNNFTKYKNVKIAPFNIKTNLDEFSLVEAVIKTIEFAGDKYLYYIKLSGQDFPIKPINSLLNYLYEIYPKPIIDCTPFHKSNWIYNKFHKPRWYTYILIRARKYIKIKFIKRLILFLPFILSKFLDLFSNYEIKARKINLKIYGGSPMWILPDVIINEILEIYSKEKNTSIALLKKVWTPEEIFFQTLTMMTSNSNLVDLNSYDTISQNCQTFNYFTDENKPFMGHPYILTSKQFNILEASNYFFARKFSSEIDIKILDLIEQKLI
jgi:hypothetical protein